MLEHTSELAQTSIGTPYYLSPEICSATQYNNKIDIWMLGCTLYELCSLQKPFTGTSIHAVVQRIMNDTPNPIPSHYPQFLIDMVDWMLEKKPENRPEVTTVLQMPQMQRELHKLRAFYQSHSIPITLPLNRPPLQIKSESAEEERKSPLQNTPPSALKTSPAQRRHNKQRENSIHQMVEQAKQQQLQSPLYSKRSYTKQQTEEASTPKPTINPLIIDNSDTKSLNQNSPHFRMLSDFSEDHGKHQKSYQRVMSINTQLEGNYKNNAQLSSSSNNSEVVKTTEQQTLIKPNKTFAFGEQIFNPLSPSSPKRTILFSAFLKKKLGESRFEAMKKVSIHHYYQLLEQAYDPMDVLNNQKGKVAAVIGEENLDCIKIFKYLITSSATPSASHFRTKSAQIFKHEDLPPKHPSPMRTHSEQNSGLHELLKDVEVFQPASKPIGMNQGYEISFKNFQNFEG